MPETGGFLTEHMAAHIIAMNVVARLVVLTASYLVPRRRRFWHRRATGVATAVQIALLWIWHLPDVFAFAAASAVGMAVMHISLFAAALWFWTCIVGEVEDSRWRSLGALLITGKLFCLLGVLLVFAPRPIYGEAFRIHAGAGHAMRLGQMLPDQQLAGLLMLIACPLTYILAGVIIAARWLSEIERRPAWISREGGI
jgi:putative membrane protein